MGGQKKNIYVYGLKIVLETGTHTHTTEDSVSKVIKIKVQSEISSPV